MTSSFARTIVIPALRDFQARYPGIALSLTLDDRPVELIREGIDCAVRAGALNASSLLVARRIGSFDWIICASPDYLRRHAAPCTPENLAQHDIIGYRPGRGEQASGWTYGVGDDQRTVNATPSLREALIYS